jgi:hypothetical protein
MVPYIETSGLRKGGLTGIGISFPVEKRVGEKRVR